MKLLRIDHVDLVVGDVKQSVEFYRKFGLYPEGTIDGGQTVFLFNGDESSPVRLELHQARPGDRVGIDHISFAVDDVADATREVKFLGGVAFAYEAFENQQSGRTISNCTDPDGVLIQLCQKTSAGTYKNWE
ncbi:MAG TPA: VOC family protein [Chloroflexota bacterium]|nr:VOC family protein [Chloroflexota bacterium]